jgi:hypothetical protein
MHGATRIWKGAAGAKMRERATLLAFLLAFCDAKWSLCAKWWQIHAEVGRSGALSASPAAPWIYTGAGIAERRQPFALVRTLRKLMAMAGDEIDRCFRVTAATPPSFRDGQIVFADDGVTYELSGPSWLRIHRSSSNCLVTASHCCASSP